MPVPELIRESEDPKEVTRNSPGLYLFFQNHFKFAMAKKDNIDDLRLAFADVLAGQMLMEDPTLAKLKQKEKDGKIIYYEDEPMTNMVTLGSQINGSSYFKKWAENKSPEALRQAAEDPAKTLEEVRKVQEQEKYQEKYNDLQKARSFYEAMQATGTGRNWLGVKRKSNSPEYDRMMRSIGAVVNYDLKNKTLKEQEEDLANAVWATQEYLADKKTVRKTEDGQTRWVNAMRFLQSAMPAEEFKAYCDEVNAARGGKDQITPEMFAPPRTAERTVEVDQQDMRDKDKIKGERKAFREKLKNERPEAFKEIEDEFNEIKGLKEVDPEKYKERKKAFNKRLDDRMKEDRERQADLDPNEPKKQEQKGPKKGKSKVPGIG